MEKIEQKDHPTGLAELESLKAHWQARRNEAAAKLAELEAESGRRLLAGDSTTRQELATARADLLECEQVLLEVTRQQPLARALDNQQRARALRLEAAALCGEAERIEQAIGPHLDAIQELEGCRYIAPSSSSRFGWPAAKSQELRQRAGRLEDQAGHLEGSADQILREQEQSKRKVVAGWQA